MLRDVAKGDLDAVSGGTGGSGGMITVTASLNVMSIPSGDIFTGSSSGLMLGMSLGSIDVSSSMSSGLQELAFQLDGVIEKVLDQVDDTLVRSVDTSALANPTAADKAAITSLRGEIRELDSKISLIPDSATVQINGSSMTGAQLKALWAKTDFVINPTGTLYANGTTNGQANFNNGNPVASFNMSTVAGYSLHANGLEFLVLHEFAHFLPSAQDFLRTTGGGAALEGYTNDLARALGNAINVSTTFPAGLSPSPGFTIPDTTTSSSGGTIGWSPNPSFALA